jgi:hypothetical protein
MKLARNIRIFSTGRLQSMPSGGKHPHNGYEMLLLANKMPVVLLNPRLNANPPARDPQSHPLGQS